VPAGVMLALDLDDGDEALAVAGQLGNRVAAYKVGSQLFCRTGPEVVDRIRDAGGEVFLDLKFFDIPNTVAKAVAAAAARGVSWLTVHAGGGFPMIRAAVEAAGGGKGEGTKILAVTVLTSFSEVEAGRVGMPLPIDRQVLRLAALALDAGAHGVVCSPGEAALLRRELGSGFVIVTPGIRPASEALDDQSRVATPAAAVSSGADYLVVGRPVLRAADRRAALEAILDEMHSVKGRT
jgi:orotidine-5'-phosphate decarboxylase